MSMLNLRIPDEAKEIIEKEAKFEGKSISDYVRELIYEKIEDLEDEKFIKDYEKNKDEAEFVPFNQAIRELGYE